MPHDKGGNVATIRRVHTGLSVTIAKTVMLAVMASWWLIAYFKNTTGAVQN
jgi:hypothetical protein